jgi:DNA-binding MarR family transcriptional regulator
MHLRDVVCARLQAMDTVTAGRYGGREKVSACVLMPLKGLNDIAQQARDLRHSLARLQRRLRAQRSGGGPTRYSALGWLFRNGPLAAGELAALERLQPQSMTRVLAELSRLRLITRTADAADRRRWHIEITARGIVALHAYVRAQETWLAQALAKLDAVERRTLREAARLLDRLSDDEDTATSD